MRGPFSGVNGCVRDHDRRVFPGLFARLGGRICRHINSNLNVLFRHVVLYVDDATCIMLSFQIKYLFT